LVSIFEWSVCSLDRLPEIQAQSRLPAFDAIDAAGITMQLLCCLAHSEYSEVGHLNLKPQNIYIDICYVPMHLLTAAAAAAHAAAGTAFVQECSGTAADMAGSTSSFNGATATAASSRSAAAASNAPGTAVSSAEVHTLVAAAAAAESVTGASSSAGSAQCSADTKTHDAGDFHQLLAMRVGDMDSGARYGEWVAATSGTEPYRLFADSLLAGIRVSDGSVQVSQHMDRYTVYKHILPQLLQLVQPAALHAEPGQAAAEVAFRSFVQQLQEQPLEQPEQLEDWVEPAVAAQQCRDLLTMFGSKGRAYLQCIREGFLSAPTSRCRVRYDRESFAC
jgi:hypothetical protein